MGNLPGEQRAAVREGTGEEATAPVKNIPVPQEPGPGQILVKINWSGLCASDKSLLHDEWKWMGVGMSTQQPPSPCPKVNNTLIENLPQWTRRTALQATKARVKSLLCTQTSPTCGKSAIAQASNGSCPFVGVVSFAPTARTNCIVRNRSIAASVRRGRFRSTA